MSFDAASSNSLPRASPRVTHPCLHIRTARDAHTLFEGVRLGYLPMIRRRLSPNERDLLQSGEVFVWEEADHKGGLERWTDGRKWSASRMREPFLFYEEKALPTQEERDEKAARRATKSGSPTAIRRHERAPKLDGFTKQTYSAWVTLPGTTTPKKWHLTAYFTPSTYASLPTVSSDPMLKNIQVPRGIYVTGKGLMRRGSARSRSEAGAGEADSDADESEMMDEASETDMPVLTSSYGYPPRGHPVQPSLPSRGPHHPAHSIPPIDTSYVPTHLRNGSRGLTREEVWREREVSPWSASSISSNTNSFPLTPPAMPSPLPYLHHSASPAEGSPLARSTMLAQPQYLHHHQRLSDSSALPSIRNSPLLTSQMDVHSQQQKLPRGSTAPGYYGRSAEDQRAVGAFRLSL